MKNNMKIKPANLVIVIMVALSMAFGIFAASPGAINYSFGTNGKIVSSIGSGGNSMALLADGEILVSAFSNTTQNGAQFHIIRYNPDSTIDTTFGTETDKPLSGDFDKDGKTDLAFFRPATGEWFVLRSSTNFSTFFGFPFGTNGDIPIPSQKK